MTFMACRGVLFAISDDDVQRLVAAESLGDEAVMAVVDEIEEAWDENNLVETDKAWDAIHRCLSDGTTDFDGGAYPLNRAILGGEQLYQGDDYVIALVTQSEVTDVATALASSTKDWFRGRFFALTETDFPQMYIDEESFDYTWEFFKLIRAFYARAAQSHRAVVFTVDQ